MKPAFKIEFDERGYLDGAIMQWSVMAGEYEVIAFFEHEADAVAFAAMKNGVKIGDQMWTSVPPLNIKVGDEVEIDGRKYVLVSSGSEKQKTPRDHPAGGAS